MSWALATILVGGIATLAVFSFLFKENPFFRFFEHLYIGIAAGFGIVLTIKEFFWPKILSPMLGFDIQRFPDGTQSGEWSPYYLLYLLPMCFGLLYYFIFSARYSWLAKLVIGFTLGMSGGIALKGFFNEMMPQIFGSFKPLVVYGPAGIEPWASFTNTFFVVTLLCVMSYFFFSFKREEGVPGKTSVVGRWLVNIFLGMYFLGLLSTIVVSLFFREVVPEASGSLLVFQVATLILALLSYFVFCFKSGSGVIGKSSAIGRWLMMVCFGAFFGSTVMARMALLVERLQFLLTDWAAAVGSLFT